ncbi:MAG: alpha-2-macroglobulin family protein, partial [Acidobacteriota bacterium]
KRLLTDPFGVASAQFQLAEEINIGTYKLRASLAETEQLKPNVQEKNFTVTRYVLPKFKIDIRHLDNNNENGVEEQKNYYAPGETVSGYIQANYLFGKPITGARVDIKLLTPNNSLTPPPPIDSENVGGQPNLTDDSGRCHFSVKIPEVLAGSNYTQDKAVLALQVEVTDSANHRESRTEKISVFNKAIVVTAIPEGGSMIPGLINRIYLLTSYPDGKPAQTRINCATHAITTSTDKNGIAVLEINGHVTNLLLLITDINGKTVYTNVSFNSRQAQEHNLLVRTDRALYRVGDSLDIDITSTKLYGSVYVDLIKEGQTIFTKSLELLGGKARTSLNLTPDLCGTLQVRAYIFGQQANLISDQRLILVETADELLISAATSKASYLPGEEAQIDITVRDPYGQPKVAVLDVQAVDEAVFQLSEKQPGLEKVFLYLEKELLASHYQVPFFEPKDIFLNVNETKSLASRENVARFLLAAANQVGVYSLDKEYGKTESTAKYDEYLAKYQELAEKKVARLAHAVSKYYRDMYQSAEDLNVDIANALAAGYIKEQDILDNWGNPIKFDGYNEGQQDYYYTVMSDLEGQFSSQVPLYRIKTHLPGPPDQQPYIGQLRFSRLPATQHSAQIKGQILKDSHRPLSGAMVRLILNGKSINVKTDFNGNFIFDNLNPGAYTINISASGYFSKTYPQLQLNVGDQIEVELALYRDVEITKLLTQAEAMADPSLVFFSSGQGIVGGVEGGVVGGVVGGVLGGTGAAIAGSNINSEIKVRSYFPETLYVNPTVITDQQGHATVRFPVADSITTWRLSMLASTKQGNLGSATTGIEVFQDFFIDLALPVSLTQGDIISVPVTIYNYLNDRQDIRLNLQLGDSFTLENDVAVKHVIVNAHDVAVTSYRIRALRIGKDDITVSAKLQNHQSKTAGDAISRQIEVLPNGESKEIVVNGQLNNSVAKEIIFPANAIADASKLLVKVYPTPFSQVVEGLDSLIRLPYGCFEQTSSTTYPNVLALDYMRTTKHITAEIAAKAESFISIGYQRLVTFEVSGGGFSLYGRAPANKMLTSYGLMEFSDMSKVYEVDPRLIQRTQEWLVAQQSIDGSWQAESGYYTGNATTNHNYHMLTTAYIAWALAYSGYQGIAIERAKAFLENNLSSTVDSYTLAIIANFAIDTKLDRKWTETIMQSLLLRVNESEKIASWTTNDQTPTYARGYMAEIETTALVAQVLVKWGKNPLLTNKALQFLIEKKDSYGTWYSTQATVFALKALLLDQQRDNTRPATGIVTITVNGQPVRVFAITRDNNDLLHQFDLKEFTSQGRNLVEITLQGGGRLLYQIVGRYYQEWQLSQANNNDKSLTLDMKYDHTTLAQNETVTVTATARNNLSRDINQAIIDLGIPPGFEVISEDFERLISNSNIGKLGHITKYQLAGRQVILYLDGLTANNVLTFKYRMRPKYAIKAKTIAAKFYEYYNPKVQTIVTPIAIEVTSSH